MDQSSCNSHVDNDNHGWTRVESRKRNRKQKPADVSVSDNIVPNERRILTAKMKMVSADVEEELNSSLAARNENLKAEKPKKPKPEKEKEPIVSLSEAMAKIDQSRLASFLAGSKKAFWDEPETQLLGFLDYMERELTEVRFPWLEMFPLEAPWPKLMDVINVPFSDIPEPIYKTSVDWINQLPIETVAGFVIWGFKRTLFHLQALHEGAKFGKISEKPNQSHVAILVTLVMVLRNRASALTITLPSVRAMHIFQGQEKLPFTVWLMAQASQDYLSAGFYSWAHNLLPILGNKNCNPQSRDLILQLVENFRIRILSDPIAWKATLKNQPVWEGEPLIPPPSFEILLRLTFPASSARVKATARFEAIYPMLKGVALAGAPEGNAMKEVIQQIFVSSLKLAEEGIPALANEAIAIAIWCVTQNVDCCKDWDDIYHRNIEAGVAVLKKLVDEWKDHSLKLLSSPSNSLTLSQTMKSFRLDNEKAITQGRANGSLYEEADKSCKVILRRLSLRKYSHYCLKATTITVVVLAAAGAAAAAVLLDLHLYVTTALNN